jgi:hypothetical protein
LEIKKEDLKLAQESYQIRKLLDIFIHSQNSKLNSEMDQVLLSKQESTGEISVIRQLNLMKK